MCGLVGMAGNLNQREEMMVRQLLVVDSLRGIDSTGVAVIASNYDVKVAKEIGNPYDLFENKKCDRAFAGKNIVVIGHNRYKTQGNVNRANAHPFEFDSVVGVHNGTVHNKYRLKDGHQFDVDSQAIYNSIDNVGVKDTVAQLDGAWALVWWDKFTNELNFLRNKERPLFTAYTKDGKGLIWASEQWMVEGIAHRNAVELGEVGMLPADTHVSITIAKNGDMEKPHATACASFFVQQTGGNNQVTRPAGSGNPPTQQQQQNNPAVQTKPPELKPTLALVKKADSKNTGVAPITAKVQPIGSLAGSKTVLLEVLSVVPADGYGGRYLSCHSPSWPFANIRWYYHKGVNPEDYVGKRVLADIGPKIDRARQPSYFKVDSYSVQDMDEVDVELSGEEKLYPDYKGSMIVESVWVAKHGQCDFCSDNLKPTDRHAFTYAGQILCGGCRSDTRVTEYLKVTKEVN